MTAEPLLSICIPTYNRKNKLESTLSCLIPQCLGKNVEIVVSDNASDDGTAKYCMIQACDHTFFSYFRQKKNVGFSDNLITVLSKAKGKYLWTLGDDEALHTEVVTYLLDTITETNPSWLVCNFVKLDSPDAHWPVGGQINYDSGLRPLPLEKMLGYVGIWASFMSISVIRRDAYREWLNCHTIASSDYIGFDIALFSGRKGNCFILNKPILARIKAPLNTHRFDKFSVYFFDFFEPIDLLVKEGILTKQVRRHLANEMLLSMAGFLLLSAKIKGNDLPKVSDCVRYHARVPVFWVIIFPLLILPSRFVRGGLNLLARFVPKNSNSKLNRVLASLGLSNKN